LGALDQPYLVINGLRTAVSICYEDALLWPHWRMLFDRPDVIVSVANNWFNSSLYDAQAQRQSIESVARLVGRPLLRAVNE
jgi:apolipoprotein N-acyltransferase